jgi:hypothetical protein
LREPLGKGSRVDRLFRRCPSFFYQRRSLAVAICFPRIIVERAGEFSPLGAVSTFGALDYVEVGLNPADLRDSLFAQTCSDCDPDDDSHHYGEQPQRAATCSSEMHQHPLCCSIAGATLDAASLL